MSADIELINNLIIKDFNLEQDALPEAQNTDDLREALKKIISHLLDRDLQRLLNALYRIDINEMKVKNILAIAEPDNIATEIANLIIEREIQKIETRRKYTR